MVMGRSGAYILAESLLAEGVDTVFGCPGAAVLALYDEFYRIRGRLRHILMSHEQHAAHAADGYARSSGRVGVCVATSGPGASNLITGIAAAYMDSVPVVAITGNAPTRLLGKDSFQELDIAGVSMPVVKHNWIVKRVDDLAATVKEAFLTARSGRPGPVLIDIPSDVFLLTAPWPAPGAASGRARRLEERWSRPSFTPAQVDEAASMLAAAKRPLIYAGGGVNSAGASEELRALAEWLNAPVALSLMGLGAFPREHPLCTGLIGMHGTVASNQAAQGADLLVAAGARFSDRVTSRTDRFARNAKILHLDIDPAEVNKNLQADYALIGSLKATLPALLDRLRGVSVDGAGGAAPHTPRWGAEGPPGPPVWASGGGKAPPASPDTGGSGRALGPPGGGCGGRRPPLHPRYIVETAAQRLGGEAIVVTDVGQHQMWTAQFYPVNRPRSFLSSGGLGAMGYGLGAAVGAAVANPGRPVALFTGDGSFRMNSAELAEVAALGLPVLIVLFNNRSLGMVRQWQSFFYGRRHSASSLPGVPDFQALCGAYGVPAYRACDEASFQAALEQAMPGGRVPAGGALVEAIISEDENVLPMVPSGRPIDEQIV